MVLEENDDEDDKARTITHLNMHSPGFSPSILEWIVVARSLVRARVCLL